MKNGLDQFKGYFPTNLCSMCGASPGEIWETQPTRTVSLILCQRLGDPTQQWVLCDECNEGLKKAIIPD